MDDLCTNYKIKLSVQNESTSPYDYESTSPYDFSRTATSPTSPPASWAHHRCTPEDAVVKPLSQTTTCAEEALKHYNSKHDTMYKLVNPVNSCVALYDKVWLHANFTASESSREGRCNSSPKLFFAELMFIGIENSIELYSVTACCPLDEVEATTRCDMCRAKILHPTDGFLQGKMAMDVLSLCTNYETKLSVQNESTSPYESTVPYDRSRTPTSPPASWAHHRCTPEDGVVNTFPQTTTCAEEALKYYNKKHDTDYKLVKPINSGVVLYDKVWLHANFTASESSREGYSNSSPKLFFAELMFIGIENSIELYSVTVCCPLDDVEVTTHCEMCEVEMSHPTTGFLQGLPESRVL